MVIREGGRVNRGRWRKGSNRGRDKNDGGES